MSSNETHLQNNNDEMNIESTKDHINDLGVKHYAGSSVVLSGGASTSPTSFTVTSSISSTNQSKENFEGYLAQIRNERNSDYDRDDSTQSSNSLSKGSTVGINDMGLSRSKTRHIFSSSEKFQSHPDLKDLYDQEQATETRRHADDQNSVITPTKFFGRDVHNWTKGDADEPEFNEAFRTFIDGHISKARKTRELKYNAILNKIGIDMQDKPISVASNSFVPYPALRHERRFLYDVDTYPLQQHLSDILGVSDLSLIHKHHIQDKKTLMKPLIDSKKRQAFHRCYDNFVTSFCIPLLHSQAMEKQLFHHSRDDRGEQKISYRYQAFPCIRINRPGEFSIGPHCDMSYGHSMGNVNFHIPLTPTYGTNALYTESHPGREDWHPLKTKTIGLGYIFDGARCIHFTLENSTMHTRVSLDFRIAIHRQTKVIIPPSISSANVRMMMDYKETMGGFKEDEEYIDVHDVLCNKKMLLDNYSIFPGYYDEAYVDLGMNPVVCKHNGSKLLDPDRRVGFPF